jgi:hypothetical protein
MANYDTTKFNLVQQAIAGRREWVYTDTGPVTDVIAAGFVTDGAAKGAKVDDYIRYLDSSRHITYGLHVASVTDTGATQVTFDGQVIVSDTS